MTDPLQATFDVFDASNPVRTQGAIAGRFSSLYTDRTGRIGKAMSTCAKTIGEIRHGETVHIVSMGEWSAEHMLCHIAEQIGPCDLMMATWSVSNDAVLRLATAMDRGWLRTARLLLDWRVKVRRPDALAVLRKALSTADLRLDNCHAKVYLLGNENWHVSLIGSPNMTTNPRIEASVMTESEEIWRFHANWLSELLDDGHPFSRPKSKKGRKR